MQPRLMAGDDIGNGHVLDEFDSVLAAHERQIPVFIAGLPDGAFDIGLARG